MRFRIRKLTIGNYSQYYPEVKKYIFWRFILDGKIGATGIKSNGYIGKGKLDDALKIIQDYKDYIKNMNRKIVKSTYHEDSVIYKGLFWHSEVVYEEK